MGRDPANPWYRPVVWIRHVVAISFMGGAIPASPTELTREVFVASDAGLSRDEVAMISTDVAGVSGVASAYWVRMVVERGESRSNVLVIADERNEARAESSGGVLWPLALGTAITDEDDADQLRVSVIGDPVRESLFPAAGDPVGEEILLGGQPFLVKGVLAPHPPFEGVGPPHEARAKTMLGTRLYVPFRTGVAMFFGGKPVSTVSVSVEGPERLDEVVAAIQRMLGVKHGDGLAVGIVPVPP